MENTCYFVCSRGLLKSCDFHSLNPKSTCNNDFTYLKNMLEKLDKQNWWSMFQLVKGQLNYARLCVGYDASITDDDKGEYTIWIKYVRLKDNEYTRAQLDIYGK